MLSVDSLFVGLLLDISLKATLLLALALLVVPRLQGVRAALRLRLLQVALVGAIALLPLGVILPRWSLPLVPDPLGRHVNPVALGKEASLAQPSLGPKEGAPTRLHEAARKQQLPFSQGTPETAATPGSAISRLRPPVPERTISYSTTLVALVWLLGVAWSFRRQRIAHLRVAELERDARVELDQPTLAALEDAAALIEVKRPVRLLTGDRVSSAITWGHSHPVVMLPAHHLGWSDERRAVVFLHELAHVRRGDWLVRVLARSACALYWFHPLAWIALARLVVEQEHACDEAVMALGTPPSSYAQHLLSLARDQDAAMPPIPLPALPMARRPQLEVRLMSILRDSNHRSPIRKGVFAVAALLILIVLVPVLAAVEPWMQETEFAESIGEPQQEFLGREQALEELSGVVREFEQLEQKLEPYETRLATIELEIRPTEELVESVEVSLQPFEQRLEAIEMEMRPFESELAAIEARLRPHEAMLEQAEMGLEPLEHRLEQMETEMQPFEAQLAELESQLEPLEARMQEAERSFSRHGEQLEKELSQHAEESHQLTGAQREEFERLSEEFRSQTEPFRLQMEQVQAKMRPVFDEMKKIHELMKPVHERMQTIHREMEPAFERMREVHVQMRPVFEEMRTIQEKMRPMHDRMRAVHQQMEPEMERMRSLQIDMEPVHDRMREVHREMQPAHDEMKRLHKRFEKVSKAFIDAVLRETLASLGIDDGTIVEVRDALSDALHTSIDDNHLRFRGSASEIQSIVRKAVEERGVAAGEAAAVSELVARALLDLDVEIE